MRRTSSRTRTKRHQLTPILPTPTTTFRRGGIVFNPGLSHGEYDELRVELQKRGGSMYATGSGGLSLEIYLGADHMLYINIQYDARPIGRAS